MFYSVLLVLEKQREMLDLLMVVLDDFELIFGLDFLKKDKIALMPYLDGALIANEICLYFVSCCKISVVG